MNDKESKEVQIAEFLQVANDRLVWCEIIMNYPSKSGRKNFDTASPIDTFYKNVCSLSFYEALLIIGSLLDNKDARVISLWNLIDFRDKKKEKLQVITNKFIESPLKQVRDQIVAHQDRSNPSNLFPFDRMRGCISSSLIGLLREILKETISEFCDYATNFSTPYSDEWFNGAKATEQIETALSQAKPKLTDSLVI